MEVVIDGIVYVPKEKDAKVEPVILEEHFKFEVHAENLGEMNWKDAVKAVKKLGDGWRLPTVEECSIMYRNQVITENYYWSSTEGDDSYDAWGFSFSYGYTYSYGKNNTYYVRAVRTI